MKHQNLAPMRALKKIASLGIWIGGSSLLLSSVLISLDLTLRNLFGWSFGGADEIAGYILAIVSAWAFPITLLSRSHIRVDVLYSHIRSGWRVILDLFAILCLAIYVSTLTYYSGLVLLDSITYGSRSNTPLQIAQWIPQSIWFAGYLFFIFTIFVLLLCSIYLLIKRDISGVTHLIGINSLEEEIEKEAQLESSIPTESGHTRTNGA